MALFTRFAPWWSSNTTTSPWDLLDDHPFFNLNSSFFREANIGRANRANVQETDNEYKIELEVPGYQKEEIHIEFSSDAKSVTISGKHESSYEEGPAEGVVEEGKVSEEKGSKEGIEKKESKSLTETRKETTVEKPTPKFWISERSVGEFSRTFSFATPLNIDKAVAKLESGVLTLTIPKATTVTTKKITIS